jgi:hypothetical protein
MGMTLKISCFTRRFFTEKFFWETAPLIDIKDGFNLGKDLLPQLFPL